MRAVLPRRLIKPFLTRRFMKFAAVGASGVVVNLGTLWLLRLAHVHTNLASALAIEVSILSNFTINHLWTFGDRRHATTSLLRQGVKFHLVSLVGGIIQFAIFVAMNVGWLLLFGGSAAIEAYTAGTHGFVERWLLHPIRQAPEVGSLVYVSQLAGIGGAMVWNYLLNFYWTWAEHRHQAAPELRPVRAVVPEPLPPAPRAADGHSRPS